MNQKTHRILTSAQRTALILYAAEKGGQWKAKLRLDWENANASIGGEVSAELQQVRNSFGPMWLNRTTLKQIKAMSFWLEARTIVFINGIRVEV